MTIQEFKTNLRNGEVAFQFRKVNGEIRKAIGTTKLDIIPMEKHPKGGAKEIPNIVKFFDLEKREWRSFRFENLLG